MVIQVVNARWKKMKNKDLDKLIHKVVLRGDPKYRDLSLQDKVKLMDSFLNPESPKALIVDFDFSHTGRKINRRIYSKIGHIQTANDLVTPYLKPITEDHDMTAKKIIGRIIAADYVPTMEDAANHAKLRNFNSNVINELDKALFQLDYEKIRDLLKRYNLDKDKRWMGVGKISAKTKIVDKDAIERFIDGRYQTFSAETDSDTRICSECLVDWMKDGPCDHYWESDTFCMTGNMIGSGSSVVTHPADDLSLVTGLTFADSQDQKFDINISLDNIMFTDSHQQLVVVDKSEISMNDLIKKYVLSETLTEEEADTLYDSVFEDEQVKAFTVIEDDKEIKAIDCKLVKEARKILPAKALVGVFPITDAAHAKIATWLLVKGQEILDSEKVEGEDAVKISETISKAIVKKAKVYAVDQAAETSVKTVEEINIIVDDIAARYSEDKLKSISKEDFESKILDHVLKVAKDYSIDLSSGTALIEENTQLKDKVATIEANLDEQKVLLADLSNQKSLVEDRYGAIKIEYKELFADHLQLFKEIDVKNVLMEDFTEKVIKLLTVLKPSADLSDKSMKNIYSVLDSLDVSSLESKLNDGLTNQQVSQIDDPLIANVEQSTNSQDKLSDFEKNQIEKYKKISQETSKSNADKWFNNNIRKYCSKDFHPSKYLE